MGGGAPCRIDPGRSAPPHCAAIDDQALVATLAGLLTSYHADLPSGPAIVLAAAALWVISLIAGPVDGLLPRLVRRRHLAG